MVFHEGSFSTEAQGKLEMVYSLLAKGGTAKEKLQQQTAQNKINALQSGEKKEKKSLTGVFQTQHRTLKSNDESLT